MLLFLPHYEASTFLFLRTAKLVTVGIALCLIGYCLRNMKMLLQKDNILKSLLKGFAFSLLCTVDEQVLGVVIILVGLSGIYFFFEKKINSNLLIFSSAVLFYFFFHSTWGRILCQYFTPELLKEHPHDFRRLIGFGQYFFDGIRMYSEALTRLTFDSVLVLTLFGLVFILCLIVIKNLKVIVVGLYFLFSGFVFSLLLVTAHPVIAALQEQSKGFYFSTSVMLAVTAFVFIVANVIKEKKNTELFKRIIVLLPLINLIIVQTNLPKYEFVHATQGGVFINSYNQVNDCIESEGGRIMGIDYSFFSGSFMRESDYYGYMEYLDK